MWKRIISAVLLATLVGLHPIFTVSASPCACGYDHFYCYYEGICRPYVAIEVAFDSISGVVKISGDIRSRSIELEQIQYNYSYDNKNWETLAEERYISGRFVYQHQTDGEDFRVMYIQVSLLVEERVVGGSNTQWVIWSPPGVDWREHARTWTIEADDFMLSRINTPENPYSLSLELVSAGIPQRHLVVMRSSYTNAMSNNGTLGFIPELDFLEGGLYVESVTVRFKIKDVFIENDPRYTYNPDWDGIRRFGISAWESQINMKLPIVTQYSEEDNTVYSEFIVRRNIRLRESVSFEIFDREKLSTSNAHIFEISNGVLIKYGGPGGDVIIPEEVTSIGVGAFARTAITSVVIHDGVVSIGANAFAFCNELKSVQMGNGVVSIGREAFYFGHKIEEVTFSESLTSVGAQAFERCLNVTTFVFRGATPPTFDSMSLLSALRTVYVPKGSMQAYRAVFWPREIIEVVFCEECGGHSCDCLCDCGVCEACEAELGFILGHVLGNDTITVEDALEILKYLVGIESKIVDGNRAFKAALITGGSEPAIGDVLEILKYLVGMESKLNRF